MKVFVILVTGCLPTVMFSCGSVGQIQDAATIEVFERRLDSMRQRLHVPGMGAAIVSQGQLVWTTGMGYADIERGVEVTPDTPFRLASVTKTIASTLLMTFVESGELDLDTPASEFGVSFENSPDVTVRHVFSHTSDGPTPGRRYSYDGYRFSTLDSVVKALTGMDFRNAVDSIVVDRLGVENLAASVSNLNGTLATPYRWDRKTGFTTGEYPSHISPAAGMMGSVRDLAQFDMALGSGVFLRKETLELAWTPQVSTTGKTLPYGLGWFVETIKGVKTVWHYGSWDCISTLYVKVPDRDITFIALANSDGLSDRFALGSGRLRTSPVARLFLDSFVY